MPVRPEERGEYSSIDLINQNGGIDTKNDPAVLTDRVPDAQNIVFDEQYGFLTKTKGSVRLTNALFPDNGRGVKQFVYRKENGEFILMVQTHLGNLYWSKDLTSYNFLYRFTTPSICNFITYNDYVWVVNGVDTPIVWNGLSPTPLVLDGVGLDYDNLPKANLSLSVPKFILLLTERIFMLNTVNNKSEIYFSRFYNEAGELIKATNNAAWISSNQILVGSDDGMEITGAAVFLGNIIVFKQRAVYIIRGEFPNYSITKLPFNIGTFFNDTIKVMNNALFFLGENGVYRFVGNAFEYVTELQEKLFKGLRTFLIRAFTRTITSESDFRTFQSINNLASVGLGGALRLISRTPTNIFQGGIFHNTTTITEAGRNILVLANQTVTPLSVQAGSSYSTYHGDLAERWDAGTIENTVDGNWDTHFTRGLMATEFWLFSGQTQAEARVGLNFNANNQFINTVTFKTRIEHHHTNDRAHSYVAFVWYPTAGGMAFQSFAPAFNVDETRAVTINDRISKLGIVVFAQSWRSGGGHIRTGALARVYEVQAGWRALFMSSGHFISRQFDTNALGADYNWGALLGSTSNLAADRTATFKVVGYDTSGQFATNAEWAAVPTVALNTIPTATRGRFYRIRVDLTNTAAVPDSTPRVYDDLRMTFPNSGSWRSQIIPASQVGVWGFFQQVSVVGGNNAGTLSIRVKSWLATDPEPPDSAAVPAVHNQTLPAVTGGDVNLRFLVDISRTDADIVAPVLEAIRFNWLSGGSVLQNASAIVHKNKYYLTLSRETDHNDTVYAISGLNGAFERYGGLDIADFGVWRDDRLLGSGSNESRVLELFKTDTYSFNDNVVEAYYETREIIGANPLMDLMLKEIYLIADTETDAVIEVDIFADKRYQETVTFEIANKDIYPKRRIIANGVLGKRFSFVVRNKSKDETFKIQGLSIMVKPIRTAK